MFGQRFKCQIKEIQVKAKSQNLMDYPCCQSIYTALVLSDSSPIFSSSLGVRLPLSPIMGVSTVESSRPVDFPSEKSVLTSYFDFQNAKPTQVIFLNLRCSLFLRWGVPMSEQHFNGLSDMKADDCQASLLQL